MLFKSINPKNGVVLREAVPFFSKQKIHETIDSSYEAFLEYRQVPVQERLERLGNLRRNLESNVDSYAKVLSK